MRHFKIEVDNGREKLNSEVTSRLREYVSFIRKQIEANFTKFDQLLASEKEALAGLVAQHDKIYVELGKVKKDIADIQD